MVVPTLETLRSIPVETMLLLYNKNSAGNVVGLGFATEDEIKFFLRGFIIQSSVDLRSNDHRSKPDQWRLLNNEEQKRFGGGGGSLCSSGGY